MMLGLRLHLQGDFIESSTLTLFLVGTAPSSNLQDVLATLLLGCISLSAVTAYPVDNNSVFSKPGELLASTPTNRLNYYL